MKKKVLGINVDDVSREEAVKIISGKVKNHGRSPFFVVTAYSEFFLLAQKDGQFKRAVSGADLVIPDGVGPRAAFSYLGKIKREDFIFVKVGKGLLTGIDILLGKVGEPVSGVWLFSKLVSLASEKKWRVFLLGGWDDTAKILMWKLKKQYPTLLVDFCASKEWCDIDSELFNVEAKRINEFRPDLLFVAYGPGKQEKWIAKFARSLKVGVAVGVGGTFDELSGKVLPTPIVIEKMGLKWLWRGLVQPVRLWRTWRAFPTFPWRVFVDSLRKP